MGRKKTFINAATAIPFKRSDPEALQRQQATLSQITWNQDTIIYGEDDALPSRIAKLVDESPATGSCIDTISQFIQGARFTNAELMDLPVDKNGTTLWDFHCMLSDMMALFEGFSVNFKYDGGYKITNAYILNFESVRLKKPNEKGLIPAVKYNPYWGLPNFLDEQTEEFPTFNLANVPREMSDKVTGGTKYKGQVFYYGKTSPLYRFYPVPYYWKGKSWIKVDAKIQEFHANNLDNNFLLSVIWNIIGDPGADSKDPRHQKTERGDDGVDRTISTKTQGEAFTEMITDALAGAAKGGAGLGLWSSSADEATKVQAFPTNSNHDLFNALQDLTTKNITIATRVPGVLANIAEGQNLGSTGNEMQKAIELMQSRVVAKQRILTQFYNKILLPNMASEPEGLVEIVNFSPITVPVEFDKQFWEVLDQDEKRDFIRKNFPTVELKEVIQPATVDENGQPVTPEQPAQGNEAFKNLTGRQLEGIQRIVRKFNKGTLTKDQAADLLKTGFGMTDEQVNLWLITQEEEGV